MDIIVLVAVAIHLAFVLIGLFVSVRYFRIWVAAKVSDLPVSLLDVIGMTFRKCNPKIVVETMIMAKQAGVELSCQEVEAACLAGADLEKISAALVRSRSEGVDVSFGDLVATDLGDRESLP